MLSVSMLSVSMLSVSILSVVEPITAIKSFMIQAPAPTHRAMKFETE
jgi:hypothetical protein